MSIWNNKTRINFVQSLKLDGGKLEIKGKAYSYSNLKHQKQEISHKEDSNIMWNEMTNIIRRVAKQILEELKGYRLQAKEGW